MKSPHKVRRLIRHDQHTALYQGALPGNGHTAYFMTFHLDEQSEMDRFSFMAQMEKARSRTISGVLPIVDLKRDKTLVEVAYKGKKGLWLSDCLAEMDTNKRVNVAKKVLRVLLHLVQAGLHFHHFTCSDILITGEDTPWLLYYPFRSGAAGESAPETLLCGHTHWRQMVYASGCMLYCILSGMPEARPYDEAQSERIGATLADMLSKDQAAAFAPVIGRCLHYEPTKRFQDLCELVHSLGLSSRGKWQKHIDTAALYCIYPVYADMEQVLFPGQDASESVNNPPTGNEAILAGCTCPIISAGFIAGAATLFAARGQSCKTFNLNDYPHPMAFFNALYQAYTGVPDFFGPETNRYALYDNLVKAIQAQPESSRVIIFNELTRWQATCDFMFYLLGNDQGINQRLVITIDAGEKKALNQMLHPKRYTYVDGHAFFQTGLRATLQGYFFPHAMSHTFLRLHFPGRKNVLRLGQMLRLNYYMARKEMLHIQQNKITPNKKPGDCHLPRILSLLSCQDKAVLLTLTLAGRALSFERLAERLTCSTAELYAAVKQLLAAGMVFQQHDRYNLLGYHAFIILRLLAQSGDLEDAYALLVPDYVTALNKQVLSLLRDAESADRDDCLEAVFAGLFAQRDFDLLERLIPFLWRGERMAQSDMLYKQALIRKQSFSCDNQSLLTDLHNAMDCAEDETLIPRIKAELVEIYLVQQKYQRAVELLRDVDPIAMLKNTQQEALGLRLAISLAGSYIYQKDLPKAYALIQHLEKYFGANDIASRTVAHYLAYRLLYGLYLLFKRQDLKALKTIQQAMENTAVVYSENNPLFLKFLNTIGLILVSQFHFSDALKYFKKSLFIARQIRDTNAESLALNNISYMLVLNGEYTKALKYLDEARSFLEFHDNPNIAAHITLNRAIILRDQGRYQRSLGMIQELVERHQEMSLAISSHSDLLVELLMLYAELGFPKTALPYLDMLKSWLAQETEIEQKRKSYYVHIFQALTTGDWQALITAFQGLSAHFQQEKMSFHYYMNNLLIIQYQVLFGPDKDALQTCDHTYQLLVKTRFPYLLTLIAPYRAWLHGKTDEYVWHTAKQKFQTNHNLRNQFVVSCVEVKLLADTDTEAAKQSLLYAKKLYQRMTSSLTQENKEHLHVSPLFMWLKKAHAVLQHKGAFDESAPTDNPADSG